jgi:hypothetical protein
MITYQVIVHELAFSGVNGAPCPIGTFRGKRARTRAIDAARAESNDRVSVTAVQVVQQGGKGDGCVVALFRNPDAYMPAGHAYCAAIYVDARTKEIIGVYALSRDSRVQHTSPPAYTLEVLTPGVVVPDPNVTREQALATIGVHAAACA